MNDRYFFCLNCRTYVPAGARWAYAGLEANGHVSMNSVVDIEHVQKVTTYWDCSNEEVKKQLLDAGEFLKRHKEHLVRYGDFEFLFEGRAHDWVEWMSESEHADDLMPRSYVEHENCRSFSELAQRVEALEDSPWWWTDPASRAHVQMHIEDIVRQFGHRQ